jgi:hypothetical protein
LAECNRLVERHPQHLVAAGQPHAMALHELAKRVWRTVEQHIIEFSTIPAVGFVHRTTRQNDRVTRELNALATQVQSIFPFNRLHSRKASARIPCRNALDRSPCRNASAHNLDRNAFACSRDPHEAWAHCRLVQKPRGTHR